MAWVVSVAYRGGALSPLFKAASQERAVEIIERFRQEYPVESYSLTCAPDEPYSASGSAPAWGAIHPVTIVG